MKRKIVVISIIIVSLIIFIFGVIYIKSNYKKQKDGETDIIQNVEKEENVENKEDEKVDEEIPKFEWKHDTAENHNMNNEALENLYKEIGNHTDIYGALVIKDDNIIGEYYKESYNRDSIFTLQSCSKSVTSSLIGIAIDKGYIRDVNVPISEYFPEILESNNQSLKEITIWHLLTHTSGLNMNDTNNWSEWRTSENWVDYILSRGSKSKPGTKFDYSTGNSHLLSVILQKATGMTAYDFGKEYLFEPLGMESVKCELDPQGYSDGRNGFSMNIYDMAKFGRLFLNKGEWEGKQIISQNWIEESTKVQFDRKAGSAINGQKLGNTQYVANLIQEHTKADVFRIEPVKQYNTSNHQELINDAQEEQRQNARPEIKEKINNFDDYDTIFIGYPIWWSDLPQILYTFLESYDFSGKNVYLFSTNGGSGLAGTVSTITSKLSSAKVNSNAFKLNRNSMEQAPTEVEKWLKEINIID